jgi:YggT family protein
MLRLYLAQTIQLLFYTYTILIFVRIVVSWFPAWHHYTWVRFISYYTDPFLNIFRRILPPLGGVIDISPLLAFFALRVMEMILLWLIT